MPRGSIKWKSGSTGLRSRPFVAEHFAAELVEKIDHYVQTSNSHAQPFAWTATADSIFAKVQRLCERISGTAH
jgi:hypothetical protein